MRRPSVTRRSAERRSEPGSKSNAGQPSQHIWKRCSTCESCHTQVSDERPPEFTRVGLCSLVLSCPGTALSGRIEWVWGWVYGPDPLWHNGFRSQTVMMLRRG
jgi:hypothetical protein